jgi:hypothetical protein
MGNISFWLRKVFQPNPPGYITIVSGLPRSGTSMMMSMLEAGGIPALTDGQRHADENNPRGYYEFERVKKLPEGDSDWLREATGKAVKVISALLEHLPAGYPYRVVFMQRELEEVLSSQRRMLSRTGKQDDLQDTELRALYDKHLEQVKQMLRRRAEVQVLYLSYNDLMLDPDPGIQRLDKFLGGALEQDAMRAVVDQALYRERNSERELG